jgi:hypothetical protein
MPKKLSDSELKAILAAEKADALAAMTATRVFDSARTSRKTIARGFPRGRTPRTDAYSTNA